MEDLQDAANGHRRAGNPIRITRNATPQEGILQFIEATPRCSASRSSMTRGM